MADSPTFADMAELMRLMPRRHHYTLRCGHWALERLRQDWPPPQPAAPTHTGALDRLIAAIDILEVTDLPGNWWELREDGQTIGRGFVATKEA